ncbi:phosphoglucosamine mutase [Kiloniella laminariae]|uniref:phosphoglucosamine mutase n=1 Tax=Kiloniella laminariae TaxID=454162 RepID=UPI000477759B|nr:phosphoglucosamine mutase [Kiloniella laminariae]
MSRKYFGTDGIRGKANEAPVTAEIALAVAKAAGAQFQRGNHRHTVVIGKDTRLSGYLLEPAMTAGFISVGMEVVLLGPLPTPAVGMLTRSLRADLGVMISASHNPYEDNGIKLFGPDGFKLSDEVEIEIEKLLEDDKSIPLAPSHKLGRARRLDDALGRYIEFVKNTFPKNLRLDGLKIVVDCANGAAYRVAPTVLYELGAEVIPVAVSPDGFNINKQCGATATNLMRETVVAHGADLGIALDGDADRLILADEHGQIVDGDQVMALIAKTLNEAGQLRGGGVVATVMSNMGLEKYLNGLGLDLIRTPVGDRYVVQAMREQGYNLGGEQSGHMVLSDHATTGDGLIAALQVLAALVRAERPASEVLRGFTPLPQLLQNVRLSGATPLDDVLAMDVVQAAIRDGESQLNGQGRVLIRKSGTEPLIRVMAEGENSALVKSVVSGISSVITDVG